MTFSGANANALIFVKIELSSQTLRYANQNVIAIDTDAASHFWEGRLLDIGSFTSGFNDFRESSPAISSLSLTLTNGTVDGSQSNLDSIIASDFWGNAAVTVYQKTITDTITLSTSDILFKGRISFPNVFTDYSDLRISFTAYDDRYNDQILVNPNIYEYGVTETATRFPNIQETDRAKQIPIIYGDFSTFPVAYAAITDIYDDSFRILKIVDHSRVATGQAALKSIDGVVVANTGYAVLTNDLTKGEIIVAVSLLHGGSRVYVACTGKTRGTAITSNFGGSSTDLLEHPIEVLYDLLSYHLGLADSYLDLTTFTDFQDAFPDLKCKAYIDEPTSAVSLIQSLTFEFGIDLYSSEGKLKVSRVSFADVTTSQDITQDDISVQSFSVKYDPNRIYFNSISIKFDPTYQGQFLRGLQLAVTRQITFHGTTRDSALEMMWCYDEAALVNRFGRLLYIASLPLKIVNLKGGIPIFESVPDEWASVTYGPYADTPLLVRSVNKDVFNVKGTMQLWDLSTLRVKEWADPGDTAPTTLALSRSAIFGVYHSDYTITSGFGDTLLINYNGGGDVTATVAAASYGSAALLATAITSALTTAAGSAVTCAYNSTTAKFTISAAANFVLKWLTTPDIGRNTLGFDVSANDTGTNTYTSDYVVSFDYLTQASQWD